MSETGSAFLSGPFGLIYADPAWQYRDKCNAGKRGACHKYDVMSVDRIAELPVEDIAAPDCVLAMWWVGPMPDEALRVVRAWGFRLVNMNGFTGHKTTKHGKDHFGMGNWTRANVESCLIAVRGKPKRVSAGVRQIIHEPVREHSRKPDQVRDALVRLCGDVPRIELFARQCHSGWAAWGNELEGAACLATPAQRTAPSGLLGAWSA